MKTYDPINLATTHGMLSSVPLTGNTYIDSILWGENSYDNVITYSFWSDASLDDAFDATDVIDSPWLSHEIAAMQQALQAWANVANITFVQANNNAPNADLGLMLVSSELNGAGMFNPPGVPGAGLGYFSILDSGWNTAGLQPGGRGYTTLIHELGHGLGLAHPHDTGGGSAIYPGVFASESLGDFGLNQGVWTTMSYNDGWEAGNDDLTDQSIPTYGHQATPMAFDIAALQYLYGANLNYNTGNNVYTLPTANGGGTFYSAIWDAGGNDTISAATALVDTVINLNDAPLVAPIAGGYISGVAGVYGGFTIANGVTIENAFGGNRNDTLVGNAANNGLYGRLGNDTLFGEAGSDVLGSGQGNDTLYGGSGNDGLYGKLHADILYGQTGNDVLGGGQGSDQFYGGAGNDQLDGKADNDTLNGGNGTDILNGNSGNDILIGANTFGAAGQDEYDILTGGLGTDVFVLGDTLGAYYSSAGYATITDFDWPEGDNFQVAGSIANYALDYRNWSGGAAQDTLIYYQNNLIGVVEDTTNVFLSIDFTFV